MNVEALKRADFDRFFAAKNRELWRWAFSPQRRRNYRDPAVIARIVGEYAELPRLPQTPIPKRIFMLWQQGWDVAPPVVRACADAWRRLNPEWELTLVDDSSLATVAPGWASFDLPPKLHRTALSNVARLQMLKTHGGVWADATLFPTRPLDDWLPHVMASGIFMFSKPRLYRDVDIWFIAAAEGNAAVARWHDLVRQYFAQVPKPHHYYWMEYLFEMLEASDAVVRFTAEQMPKITALGPLAIPSHKFDRKPPDGIADLLDRNVVPVHKLSHKWWPKGRDLRGTPVGKLTGLTTL